MPTLPAVKPFVSSTAVRIYRIPCRVFENLTARVYLLLGAGPPTLVDTGSGSGESTRDILTGLETVRTQFGEPVRPSDVRRIIITHGHVDHVGGLKLGLAGHEPVIHDLYGRIETIRASHQRRLDRLLDIVRKSRRPLAISEISRTMYATKRGFDEVLALTDVGARVEYLHQRGQLLAANLDEIETEENPVGRYCVA